MLKKIDMKELTMQEDMKVIEFLKKNGYSEDTEEGEERTFVKEGLSTVEDRQIPINYKL